MLHETLYYRLVPSPVGLLRLVASDKGLRALEWEQGRHPVYENIKALLRSDEHPPLAKAAMQLGEYFAGRRTRFDLALDPRGTVFQLKAWRELQAIPYGETISYGEQARRMGDANKARAAGMANGRNPISIIVPCHRVIGATGALTGFGGGLKVKQYLLDLERMHMAAHQAA